MAKDGSFIVLFKDNQRIEIFLVWRSDMPLWVLTGGGIEAGETPKVAALREVKEETGFEIKFVRKIGKYIIIDSQGNKIRETYLYEGRIISGEFKPEFPGCRGDWFPVLNLPKETTEATRQKILDAKKQPAGKIFTKRRKDTSFKLQTSK